jgi:hypothetical protein
MNFEIESPFPESLSRFATPPLQQTTTKVLVDVSNIVRESSCHLLLFRRMIRIEDVPVVVETFKPFGRGG